MDTISSHKPFEPLIATYADMVARIASTYEARPDTLAEQASARRVLLEALRTLPLATRQLVSLHLEGFSNREIGEALGLREGNVAVRLTRARERLNVMIGENA